MNIIIRKGIRLFHDLAGVAKEIRVELVNMYWLLLVPTDLINGNRSLRASTLEKYLRPFKLKIELNLKKAS